MIIDRINNKKNKKIEFDGMWSSSLTDSSKECQTQKVLMFLHLNVINQIFEVAKPMIYDGDTGGIMSILSLQSEV